VTGRVVVTAAPFIDRVTAAVPERAGLIANLVIRPGRIWRLEGLASAGRVLEGLQKGDQAWAASGKVGRSLGAFVELSVGVRALLQDQPRYAVTKLDLQGFMALELHPRKPDPVLPDPSAVKDPLRPRTPAGAEDHP
jgi:hypothetical protein